MHGFSINSLILAPLAEGAAALLVQFLKPMEFYFIIQ